LIHVVAMKTEWDYTDLAKAYLKRPDYADLALDEMIAHAGLRPGALACDVGAGVAHLTRKLELRGLRVVAVEPNDAMRTLGSTRTRGVVWYEGTGEDTRQPDATFDLVTFGSSFNVTDRARALVETARIARPGGWFACMWNHRDLEDPLQRAIETTIARLVPGYAYGTRREDQSDVIRASGLFSEVRRVEGRVIHGQTRAEVVEAWRSHATLQRQAGERFDEVVDTIAALLDRVADETVLVPYTTRIWMAQSRRAA
jgi:ubiquinone/menaquinone biosynthesis C-methylase UbiE